MPQLQRPPMLAGRSQRGLLPAGDFKLRVRPPIDAAKPDARQFFTGFNLGNFFRLLDARIVKPDLVVYLQARPEVLIQRIRKRGVDFERAIPASYLARLADAYSRYFYQYDAAPLLIVNSERLNFVDDPDHFALLCARIAGMRGRREFFNLAS